MGQYQNGLLTHILSKVDGPVMFVRLGYWMFGVCRYRCTSNANKPEPSNASLLNPLF